MSDFYLFIYSFYIFIWQGPCKIFSLYQLYPKLAV
uniref:Uncharacterized protein n=1 Tax=Anguilla anguilla TaxID=7936 RepID=A0A0E9RJC6_ANGAN